MKKLIILAAVAVVSVASVFAEAPKSFAFEFGAGGAYTVDSGDITLSNVVGFSYTFSDTFRGGFTFNKVGNAGGGTIDSSMINISIIPAPNTEFSLYTGVLNGNLGFGMGLGYDFFTNQSNLFSALGIYFDWYASNAAAANVESIENGGLIAIGLKTTLGI